MHKTSIVSGLVSADDRKCTDGFFAVVFWLSIIAMLGISAFGFMKGDIFSLIAPVDANGHICGSGDAIDFQYLFMKDIESGNVTQILKSGNCVKSCPGQD